MVINIYFSKVSFYLSNTGLWAASGNLTSNLWFKLSTTLLQYAFRHKNDEHWLRDCGGAAFEWNLYRTPFVLTRLTDFNNFNKFGSKMFTLDIFNRTETNRLIRSRSGSDKKYDSMIIFQRQMIIGRHLLRWKDFYSI